MEKSRQLVIIKGAGGKAFCSGGDVKLLITDKEKYPKYFQKAYNTNYLIVNYKIPYISFINGITVGSAFGVSFTGAYRVATENTVFGLPETKIGIFPDATASYFLPKLKDNLGIYLGLTGDTLKGSSVVRSGIATHYVKSERLNELEVSLSRCASEIEVQHLLNKFNEPLKEFSLAPNIKHIKYCFAASTVEEIIKRLEKVQNDWSLKTIEGLHKICPGALKITLRCLQRGSKLDLRQCLKMEYRLACRAIENHDFPEGVRAILVDKDNNPKWKPNTLAEVGDDYVESHFKNLPLDREFTFIDNA